MSTVGLTKAMRRAMTEGFLSHGAMERKLLKLGLMELHEVSDGIRAFKLTPRGHAALAAPRMTEKEYAWLCLLELLDCVRPYGSDRRADKSMCKAGLAKVSDDGFSVLTPAGRTALNNVRAAMPGEWRQVGSPDWKEGL